MNGLKSRLKDYCLISTIRYKILLLGDLLKIEFQKKSIKYGLVIRILVILGKLCKKPSRPRIQIMSIIFGKIVI